MSSNQNITVYGAYGHTGRFVVAELKKRGLKPILSGRDVQKLTAFGLNYPEMDIRPASIDDPASLDRSLVGASAVINCAGPFFDTAAPLIEAAVRAGAHYLDVTAEQPSALNAFDQFADTARDAGIVVAPAMAFYGGLADLLATVALGDWPEADAILIAVALDSWMPTQGTRLTGQRNVDPHVVLSNNKLEFMADPPPTRTWHFPEPFGMQDVVGLALAEIITISRHLRTPEIHPYMNLAPLKHIRDPDTPTPTAADDSGRSSQIFVMDVIAIRGSEERRATASGRDIYAITAPIVVEAAMRIVNCQNGKAGVFAAGELFEAEDFLNSLGPELKFERR